MNVEAQKLKPGETVKARKRSDGNETEKVKEKSVVTTLYGTATLYF